MLAGIPALGAPGIQGAWGLSYAGITMLLLVAPTLLALILETPLLALSDRCSRKHFVVGGLGLMAAGAALAGVAATPLGLALALGGWYLGSGLGVGLAQAELVAARPRRRERTLLRWTLMAAAGDLAAPGLFAALAWLSLDWRAAFLLTAVLAGLQALALTTRRFPAEKAPPAERPGLVASLRDALTESRLWFWLAGCWLCDLLDEILVVLATLRLRDDLGAGPLAQAAVIAAFTAGSLAGLAAAERALSRVSPLRLLRWVAPACALAYLGWLASTTVPAAGLFLFAVGSLAAPMYPIAKAQAYAALPDRPGAVGAVGNLFTPASLVLPLALGVLADRAGLPVALAVLVVQPLGLWLMAGLADAGGGRGKRWVARND